VRRRCLLRSGAWHVPRARFLHHDAQNERFHTKRIRQDLMCSNPLSWLEKQ
jgi:hypothetical protein